MDPIERIGNVFNQEGASGLARAISSYAIAQADRTYQILVTPMLIKGAIRKLRKESEGITITENLVELTSSFNYYGINIKPVQVKREIIELCQILKQRKVKNILEIGTASGGSLFLFTRCASGKIFSIDMPVSTLERWNMKYRKDLYLSFRQNGQEMLLAQNDSHDIETLEKIKIFLKGEKFDFIFIDGDHSYEGVKKDFEMYSPLVSKNGIVAFHDIAENKKQKNNPVLKYYNEIKWRYEHMELCYNKGNGFGIGILFL